MHLTGQDRGMRNRKIKSPFLAGWILKRIVRYDEDFSIHGDFDEEFCEIAKANGKLHAWIWTWRQFFCSLPFFIRDLIYWRLIMFKNYLKVAFRAIQRHKGYSFINIAGLAIGMACCILMLLWIQDELNFDNFHDHRDNIYRVIFEKNRGDRILHHARGANATGPALEDEYPEIKVLGPGCFQCDQLTDKIRKYIVELDLDVDFEHVKNINVFAQYGVFATPALIIDGKVRTVGKVPSDRLLRSWLEELKQKSKSEENINTGKEQNEK